jgi:hypothetical protein
MIPASASSKDAPGYGARPICWKCSGKGAIFKNVKKIKKQQRQRQHQRQQQQQKKKKEEEEENDDDGLSWALRARNIKSRRFGLVCYELWEYYGAGAMDAAERDDVALLDPSLFGGLGGDSSSDDDDDDDESSDGGETAATDEPTPEPVLQQAPVEWAEGRKVVTRVTAVLRIAPPGAAEDYGGVEWVHRH